jgi:hypothetical protein
MSDDSSSPSSPDASSDTDEPPTRLIRGARRVASLAQRLTTGVAWLAGASAGAGLLLWGLFWWPITPRPVVLLGAGASLLLLLAPAATLGLFYQGLYDLQALPDRLSTHARRTAEHSAEAARATTTNGFDGPLGWLWGLVKQIWALRTVLTENRALLIRYGALLRFVTPGFLLLVALAAGLSFLLVPIAAVAGLVTLMG